MGSDHLSFRGYSFGIDNSFSLAREWLDNGCIGKIQTEFTIQNRSQPMKTTFVAAAFFAVTSFAATSPVESTTGSSTKGLPDTSRSLEFKRDSIHLPPLPDSIKAKMEQQGRELDARMRELANDTTKTIENKLLVDSLRQSWEAKRDTQIANIEDSDVRTKVEARIEKVSEHKAAVKARIDEKKARIEAKRAGKPTSPVAE